MHCSASYTKFITSQCTRRSNSPHHNIAAHNTAYCRSMSPHQLPRHHTNSSSLNRTLHKCAMFNKRDIRYIFVQKWYVFTNLVPVATHSYKWSLCDHKKMHILLQVHITLQCWFLTSTVVHKISCGSVRIKSLSADCQNVKIMTLTHPALHYPRMSTPPVYTTYTNTAPLHPVLHYPTVYPVTTTCHVAYQKTFLPRTQCQHEPGLPERWQTRLKWSQSA